MNLSNNSTESWGPGKLQDGIELKRRIDLDWKALNCLIVQINVGNFNEEGTTRIDGIAMIMRADFYFSCSH